MHSKIKKAVIFLYPATVLLIIGLLLYLFVYDYKHTESRPEDTYRITTINEYETHYSKKGSSIDLTINVDPHIGNVLAFSTSHQYVEVYEGENLLYKNPVSKNNPFGASPGYAWHFINLPKDRNNIKINVSSPYSSYARFTRPLYIGNTVSITSHIINKDMFSFILCVLMFFIGACMFVYYCIVKSKTDINRKLALLGIFSMLLAIWSIDECYMVILLFHNSIALSYISFLSLMILPMPYAIFIKSYYEDNSKVWDTFLLADACQILLCIILQLTGIADLRTTLWSTHLMIIFIAVIVLQNSFVNINDNTKSLNIKIHIICIFVCAVALIMDIINFYLGSDDNNIFGRIGFLLYIVVLGLSSTRESIDLMKKGRQAKEYRDLAYTDQMTGMNNRTCFNMDFEKCSEKPDNIMIIDFDLNNLKHINDTYGHSSGDKYISGAANIISEIFANIGTCYRVGGDEFVTIVKNAPDKDIVKYMAMLESGIDSFNRENKGFRMQIAYGCATYDSNLDKSLEDTYNRADKIMYEDKKKKKSYSKI